MSFASQLAAQRMADLLASIRITGPSTQAGITTGPGNQGTQNQAHLVGQAGTAMDRFSLPRQMHFGGGGSGVARP